MQKKQGFQILFNNIDFQSHNPNVCDCGKHVYCFIEGCIDGLNLKQYQTIMKQTKNQSGLSYDEIVCKFWDIN